MVLVTQMVQRGKAATERRRGGTTKTQKKFIPTLIADVSTSNSRAIPSTNNLKIGSPPSNGKLFP